MARIAGRYLDTETMGELLYESISPIGIRMGHAMHHEHFDDSWILQSSVGTHVHMQRRNRRFVIHIIEKNGRANGVRAGRHSKQKHTKEPNYANGRKGAVFKTKFDSRSHHSPREFVSPQTTRFANSVAL